MKIQGVVRKTISIVAIAAAFSTATFMPTTASAKDKKKAPVIDTSKLAWPLGTKVPRIRYVGAYYGEEIKGIKKQGFLERLAGVEDQTQRSFLRKPYAVAVDTKGRIYVTDTVTAVVFVFDLEKKTIEYRGDKPPAALKKPMGIAFDDQDRLFVSDAEMHNVTIFDPNGEVVTIFGDDQLERPGGVAVDSAIDRIYVADSKVHKVAQFNLKTLKFERWIGKAPDEVKTEEDKASFTFNPTNVAVDDDGLLYVVDTFLDHVLVFDSEGDPVRTIGDIGTGAGRFMRPRGIALDSDGHIYVTDAMNGVFQVLDKTGQPLMAVGGVGDKPGQFQVPAAITIDRNNRVIVADQMNARIQVFRYVTDEEAAAEKKKLGITDKDEKGAQSAAVVQKK